MHLNAFTDCFFLFQIDDIKLIRDHETGRSQGYGFLTVRLLSCFSKVFGQVLPNEKKSESLKLLFSVLGRLLV